MPIDELSGVYYETHGDGPTVLVGLPFFASQTEILGQEATVPKDDLCAALSGFRLVFMDYPSIGGSRDISPDALNVTRVCADILKVADHAGAERFAWFGYSWSAAVGLQLASRSARICALAIGGWPPLNAPYPAILAASLDKIGKVEASSMKVLRSADQYKQWSVFYKSIEDWDEASAVSAISCPKLLFFGERGDLTEAGYDVPIATRCRENRPALEAQGWRVHEIPGLGHEVGMRADLVCAVVAPFLRNAAPWG